MRIAGRGDIGDVIGGLAERSADDVQ